MSVEKCKKDFGGKDVPIEMWFDQQSMKGLNEIYIKYLIIRLSMGSGRGF